MSHYLGQYWRQSRAIRGPLGAILSNLGRSNYPSPPPPRQEGGGVNPSPEQGEEKVLAERRQSWLNHLRPQRWWDSGEGQANTCSGHPGTGNKDLWSLRGTRKRTALCPGWLSLFLPPPLPTAVLA